MSIAAPTDRVQPELTTVARYTLSRLGDIPVFYVHLAETVRSIEEAQVISASESEEGAGFDTLVIEDWAGRDDLEGRELLDDERAVLGVISSAVTSPEEVDEEGNVIAPARLTLVLDTPLAEDPTGMTVAVQRANPLGMPVHEMARGGREWELMLTAAHPEAAARMAQMLGNIMFQLVKHSFIEDGVEKTDAEIWAIVQALVDKGLNIDTFISRECEALELERRSGGLDYAEVFGAAPAA